MMDAYILDGRHMTDKNSAHEEIQRVLELPDWYGANLDALNDMLGECEGPIRMVNTTEMLNAIGAYGCRLLEVFYEGDAEFTAE